MTPGRSGPAWSAMAVLLCIVAWLGVTAGLRPLTLPDEGRYVGVAWEMVRSGDWLVPTLDGLPFFHKPPLLYWLTAASMSVFGPNEWAARLASVVGASAVAWGLFLFVRRCVDEASARLSLLVLLTMPMFFIGAQFSNHDMLVAGCIGLAVLLAAHATLAREQGQPHRRALLGAFAFAALGMLSKGLIGFVLPVMVLGAWMLASRRPRALLNLVWPPGLAVFLLVGAPWFVAMQLRFDGFFDYFVVVQHFKRFTAGGFNNEQPVWFFVAVVALLCLPWTPWIARAFRCGWFADPARRDVRLLMVVWCVVVLLFFSIPRSKLVGYVLPALPPLAFILAEAIRRAPRPDGAEPAWIRYATFGAAALCVAGVVAAETFSRHGAKLAVAPALPRMAASDRVLMLDRYVYDAGFYLRLPQPAYVLEDWPKARQEQRDNWRKELLDAGDFAPALAARLLVGPDKLPAILCQPAATWVLGDDRAAANNTWLAHAEPVGRQEDLVVWRFPGSVASDPACLGTPTSGSAGRSPPPPRPTPLSEASRSEPPSSATPAHRPTG